MTVLAPGARAFLSLLAALVTAPVLAYATPATPAAPAAGCQYLELAKLPVRYTGPALSLTIEGQIDGTPADMLVDTGAAASMLTRTATERRGLKLSRSDERMVGIGGHARMYTARIREFRAGPALLRNERVRVAGDMGFTPSFDAILSAGFLLQTDFEISLATREIRFFKPTNCKKAMLAYWAKDGDAVEIPFATTFSRHPNPYFKVQLNGKDAVAMIDSGAATTVVTRKAAERAGLALDAPGVERAADAVGLGLRSVPRWNATIGTLQIGRETIEHAEVGVLDTDEMEVDVLLGADFLRAHRVLFAMSQKKLYISYVGGEPLGQRRSIEPWIQQEAEAGNGDAQLLVGFMHAHGHGVPRDQQQARAWIEKAAAGGHPRGQLLLGQRLVDEGRHAEAAGHLRQALERMPAERHGALWLYAARMHGGDAQEARRELAARFARDDANDWPRPVADFYLGTLSEEKLLALAREDGAGARQRTCQARVYIAQGYRLAGEPARAQQVLDGATECRPPPAGSP